MWLQFIVLFNLNGQSHGQFSFQTKETMFPFGEEEGLVDLKLETDPRKIVDDHNFFRSRVSPNASNMLEMSWHPEAAYQAQRYANKCIFAQHAPAHERTVRDFGVCSQNMFASTKRESWYSVIQSWFSEGKMFTYGDPTMNNKFVGHYTQMVWATNHKVGCGMAYCTEGPWGHFYNYVCHYCPGGNVYGIMHYPYKVGPPCGDCPDHCTSDSLCTNSCMAKDVYSNCGDLVGQFQGFCKRGICNATCTCRSRIHKEYPWI